MHIFFDLAGQLYLRYGPNLARGPDFDTCDLDSMLCGRHTIMECLAETVKGRELDNIKN